MRRAPAARLFRSVLALAFLATSQAIEAVDSPNRRTATTRQTPITVSAATRNTVEIVFQHAWSSSNDPYTTTDASDLLDQFREHWNANFLDAEGHDLAHLLFTTGRFR